MSDINKLNSFSVPEEAFENFQAASIHKQMDLNTYNASLSIPACANNVEISSTIEEEDEVQNVNSTSVSPVAAPSKRCLKRKAHTVDNITYIDSTLKDQQVSTTQESSEIVNEDDGLHENLEKQVLLETNLKPRRSRGRPPKRKVTRPRLQRSLVEQDDLVDKDATIEVIPSAEDYAISEYELVDSTTSQITHKTNINQKGNQEKQNKNSTNEEVKNVFGKPEYVVNATIKNSLNKIDINTDTVKIHKDSITLASTRANDNIESDDDDPDEISLSKLKKTLAELDNENTLIISQETDLKKIIKEKVIKTNEDIKKRSSKVPVTSHFVHNIESVISDDSVKVQTDKPPLIDIATAVESCSGRPQRKRGKVNIHFDEDSDEDPFANVELSDDDSEPRGLKKGKRYYSDDEYIPDEKREKKLSTDSDIEKDVEEFKKSRKKRNSKGLKKKQKFSDTETTILDTNQIIDVSLTHNEVSHQNKKDVDPSITNSHVKKNNNISNSWGNTNEFENFLAQRIQGTNLKIKRVTNRENTAITHLEIPVIDSYTKTADVYSQTNVTKLCNNAVQTSSHSDIRMDKNVLLTTIQAEKACEFLTDMVKATSKLGELMTQKSDDFIQKKINTKNITDTIKMDHYVKKSLLLFKLAKDSIMDIEETLAMKYENFLKEQKLSRYTTVPKLLTPTVALKDGDSDCEIVEETVDKRHVKGKQPSSLNLKTVFLNKELSIKIAKKPSEEQKIKNKINIKGKSSVWISDSVLVKKVKPTQSFLAQDSRNKKPPDTYVTKEMVSDFFKKYYRGTALSSCAQLLTPEWQNWRNLKTWQNRIWCYYSNVESPSINSNHRYFQSSVNTVNVNENTNTNAYEHCETVTNYKNPKSLLKLSLCALQKKLIKINHDVSQKEISHKSDAITDLKIINNAEKLSNLCLYKIKCILYNIHPSSDTVPKTDQRMPDERVSCLKMLCYLQIAKHFFSFNISRESGNTEIRDNNSENITCKNNTCFHICHTKIQTDNDAQRLKSSQSWTVQTVVPLQTLCYQTIIQNRFKFTLWNKSNTPMRHQDKKIENHQCYKVNNLLSLCLQVIWSHKKSNNEKNKNVSKQKIETLSSLSLNVIYSNQQSYIKDIKKLTIENDTMLIKQGRHIDTKENCSSFDMKQKHELNNQCNNVKIKHSVPKSLKHIALSSLLHMTNSKIMYNGDLDSKPENKLHTLTCNSLEYFENEHRHDAGNILTEESLLTSKQCVRPLFQLCFERVQLIYDSENVLQNCGCNSIQIGSVNTVPEEVFFNLQEVTANLEGFNVYSDDDEQTYDDYEETNLEDCNFESKQPMEEIFPLVQMNDSNCFDHVEDTHTAEFSNTSCIAQIKTEPIENNMQNDIIQIKTEPDLETNLLPQIQCIEAAKLENSFGMTVINSEILSCFGDDFELSLNTKEMEQVVGVTNNHEQKVFSQSSLRVRRQFEPDSDDENDNNMSLLVPNTYVPLDKQVNRNMPNTNNMVGEEKKIEKKKKNEKRIDKKKNKSKTSISNNMDSVEELPPDKEDEIIMDNLHNEIRQEDKADSSDSDSLDMVLSARRKNKLNKGEKELQTKSKDKTTTVEIQCNDVDSTQKTNVDNEFNAGEDNTQPDYTGLLEYNKYVNDLYSKIKSTEIPNATKDLQDAINKEHAHDEYDGAFSPGYNSDEPIELLQCEPSLQFLDEILEKRKNNKTNKKIKATDSNQNTYKKFHVNDTKLYQEAIVVLERLPEKFIETYFESQDIKNVDKDRNAFERLVIIPPTDQNKIKTRETGDRTDTINVNSDASNDNIPMTFGDHSNVESLSDHHHQPVLAHTQREEMLSDSPTPEDTGEMELEKLVKKEEEENRLKEETLAEELKYSRSLRSRKLSKRETKEVKAEVDLKAIELFDLSNVTQTALLTADKVMKNELLLLHTPVGDNDLSIHPSQPTKIKRKSDVTASKDDVNEDDYSSSEEEKQWVTTKEKLLKRLLKRQDDTQMDAAKRAKIVSEFIARCKSIESRKRYSRTDRSKKKIFLERQKQLSVLSRELFGETSNEIYLGKKSSQSFGKGRRNIRRVIDKKSLARSTLLANIEEIERKRRLLHRQNKMREILGCEEGVNVVVINDEVCLEYDFEENRPLVTVHPFFTQVMKAHQYEGVKFMWDACFESLELVAAGHAGGGCILAHCMGLGKTLQVLALLHTVLTHPGVGIQRVLVVCPLSTVLNWVDEINKWMGPVNNTIKVFELSKLKKTYQRAYQLEDWYTGGGIFIMGYEMFRNLTTLDPIMDNIRPTIYKKIRTALLDPGPDIIICDEGHLLKNDSSVLAVAISRIMTKRRIVLTGTPMQNNLREYYCMVNFVKPNLLGLYSEYANRFENPIMNGQHRDSREEDIKLMKARTHILHKVLEGCLQRQEAAVLYPYLPKKHEYTAFIPLTKCQSELYKHYLKHYANQAKHNVFKDYHILQKIWTHPQVLHNFQLKSRDPSKVKVEKLEDDLACEDLTASEDVKPSQTEVWWLEYLEAGNMLDSLESSNKLYAVFRILDECVALGDKVLIFSTSLVTMDSLEYFLKKIKKWSLGHEYYRLDGSVPAEVRQNWCREFNSPNNHTTNLFLISTRAGCLGLNMTAANRVIILDTSWNPAHDIQSIFRVYRFGQKKDCYIYRLVAMGTMEQKIYERSVTKQAVACRVVDSQQIDRHYSMDELTELYKFDETGSSVESGVAAGVTDVALLRVARDAPLHAVYEHDSLLRDSHDQQLPEHERAAAWRQFEMEQGHSHMVNLENSSLRTPINKIHEHDYAMSASLPADSEVNVSTKLKGKRARKSKQKPSQNTVKDETVVNENLNTNEATMNESDLTTKIKEIKKILLQQNVQDDFNDVNKIQDLVKHVQKLVVGRLKGEKFHASPLVESIAKVFLQIKDNNLTTTTLETSSGSLPKQEHNNENDRKVYRNNKRTRQMDIHNMYRDESDDGEIKKRKAAVKAKEYIHTKDDESWSQDENIGVVDTSQDTGSLTDSDGCDRAEDLPTCNEISNKDSNENKTEKPKTVTVEILDDDDPPVKIILSDDEAVADAEKSTKNNDGDKERIPLHASILENQHFINMVAYKYLEGNPILDQDAALHAAKYSAQKALKEIQETGKDLCSGPLYDIAVSSIGIETLKRLQVICKKSNPEPDTTRQNQVPNKKDQLTAGADQSKDDVTKNNRVYKNKIKQKPESSKESVSAKRKGRESSTDSDDLIFVSNDVTCKKTKNKSMIHGKSQVTRRESIKAPVNQTNKTPNKATTAAPAPAPAPATSINVGSSLGPNLQIKRDRVVPIQLIKRTSNSTITMTRPLTDECILPDDDDDVCYVNEAAATPPAGRHNSLLVASVRSGDKYPPISITQPTMISNKVRARPAESPTISSVNLDSELTKVIKQIDNKRNDKETSNTICLDSDDEDDNIGRSKQTPATFDKATRSQPLQPPPDPVFISVAPTHTISEQLPNTNKTASSQADISKSTIDKTNLDITNPLPPPSTPSVSGQQPPNNNIPRLFNQSANRMCKPGDVIRVNTTGELYFLNPDQTTVTRLLPNPMPTTIPTAPSLFKGDNKVGKIAIKALKVNTPPPAPKRGGARRSSTGKTAQNKPAVLTTPTITILPLQPTKTKGTPTVVFERRPTATYEPIKKVKVIDSKSDATVETECLDLTGSEQNDVPKFAANAYSLKKAESQAGNSKANVSVTGSPKDFMFVRAGDRTKLETTTRKRKEPTIPGLGRFNVKKKLTTPEVAGPSKNTKESPFKKLSLHDFNIDKIDDDIIELE